MGGKIDTLKDQAASQLTTTEVTYRRYKPLLNSLPRDPRCQGSTDLPADHHEPGRAALLEERNPAGQWRPSGSITASSRSDAARVSPTSTRHDRS